MNHAWQGRACDECGVLYQRARARGYARREWVTYGVRLGFSWAPPLDRASVRRRRGACATRQSSVHPQRRGLASPGRRLSPSGRIAHQPDPAERVRLRVEDVLFEWDRVGGVKEQKEVLHGLRQHERLHLVVELARRVVDVWQRRPSRWRGSVRLKGGEDLPAHLAPFWIASVIPHDEERLDRLWPANVVGGVPGRAHVLAGHVEVDVLWRQPCGCPPVHLIARLANCVGQRQVSHVHKGGRARPLYHRPGHPDHRLVKHLAQVGLALAGEQPLLDQVLVERVGHRAHRHPLVGPAAGARAQEGGVQPRWGALAAQQPDRGLGHVPVPPAARVVRQVLELELDGPVLGQNGRASGPIGEGAVPAAVERDCGARNPVCVVAEGVHHELGELFGLR
eukprot:scaffold8005_cov118-Isochrysis_galbana.AAC.24